MARQVAVLALTSVSIEFCVLAGYGALAGRMRYLAARPRFTKLTNRVAGSMLIIAGLGVASLKKAIDSQVVGVEKPNPKIFQLALDALNVPPDEAMYAGDIYAIDMLGARAAGIAGKLIDQHDMYHWVEHPKIRHVRELHNLD